MSRYGRDPEDIEQDVWAALLIKESGVSDRQVVGDEDSLLSGLRNGEIEK